MLFNYRVKIKAHFLNGTHPKHERKDSCKNAYTVALVSQFKVLEIKNRILSIQKNSVSVCNALLQQNQKVYSCLNF